MRLILVGSGLITMRLILVGSGLITMQVNFKSELGKESNQEISKFICSVLFNNNASNFGWVSGLITMQVNLFISFILQYFGWFLIDLHNLFRFALYEVITILNKHHVIWLVLNFTSV